MGEERSENAVPEVDANGTTAPEKSGKVLTDKTGEENNEVKPMDEDKKDNEETETGKMDEDSELSEEKKSTEEREKMEKEELNEEDKTEVVQEETVTKGDAEVEGKEDAKVEVEVKVDGSEEKEESEMKELNEHGKGKSGGDEKNSKEKVEKKKRAVAQKKDTEPRTPAIDRPQRERKSVERLVTSIEKDAAKEFQIEKGRGTPLKDIPNVAFKLSRRKTDDTFKLLHTILFGRRGKAVQIKSNISRFSGFVWRENEEKQKIKVKEKLDKCNKEKLLEFCDVLDVPVSKATTKKEDIVIKLIDFLVTPHVTTTVLLAEKDKASKSQKRKRVAKSSSSGGASSKSRKKATGASKAVRDEPDSEDELDKKDGEENEEEEVEEENENGVPEKSDAEVPEHSESEENASEEESEEDVGKSNKSSKASSRKKESARKAKAKKITNSSKSITPPKVVQKRASLKHSEADDDSDASQKVFSRKKKNEKVVKEKSIPTKFPFKEKAGKKTAKGKEKAKVKEVKTKLTDDDLRGAICEILKEVDFNTATFTDILKQLAQRFDTDLTERKSSIKVMIQEELTKLADEADEEDGEGDAEKDENRTTGQEVEA